LLQILDARYYTDRDAALRQLFGLASLIVANRGDMDERTFSQLLALPENQSFRHYVRFFILPASITDLSATQVRHNLTVEQPISAYVPPEVEEFITETRAYHPLLRCGDEQIDAYAIRQALLAPLYTKRSWAEQTVDFRRLLTCALSSDTRGYALRHTPDNKALVFLIRAFSLQL